MRALACNPLAMSSTRECLFGRAFRPPTPFKVNQYIERVAAKLIVARGRIKVNVVSRDRHHVVV